MTIPRAVALSCLLLVNVLASAQNFGSGYSFMLLPDDTTSQAFLPSFPAPPPGGPGFVSITPDGHFAAGGSPLRFFGTNAVADGAFPTKTKSWFIAGHLRKMGFNLVRFHHMDNPWSSQNIFGGQATTRQLSASILDRLDYFLFHLKKNGVYADINLHVARTFKEADGIADADSLPEFSKGVSYFDPVLIALQKEYARQLLTHVNPYTGLPLANDPVMAMVEITNENSLYRFWREGRLKPISAGGILMMRHMALLDTLWHTYLASQYGTTSALAASWGTNTASPGSTIIRNGGFEVDPLSASWILELHSPAQAGYIRDTSGPYAGTSSARVTVISSDGVEWHVQWKQAGLALAKDSVYTVSFAAKADTARLVPVVVMQDGSPYTGYASSSFTIDKTWKTYSFSFRAPVNEPNARLSFNIGSVAGRCWFDSVTMVRPGIKGLLPEETLEGWTVRRTDFTECPQFSDRRIQDICGFYLKIQNDFFDDMTSFLRNDLHVRVPISGTNWNVGAPDLAVQSRLDYVDNHSYWDHPTFPGIPWSNTDWFISNEPMVRHAEGGTIPWLMAGVGMRGKPFTVSEYNHAFPNIYQTEGMLFASAYGGFHGVDAMMFFDYNGSADDWETDMVSGYFDIHRNTAMMSLVPSCAYAFRSGAVAPAVETLELNLTSPDLLLAPKYDGGYWLGQTTFTRTLGLKHALRYASFAAAQSTNPVQLPAAPVSPYITDTGEITLNTSGLLSVGTPRFAAMAGFLQSFAGTRAGDLALTAGSGFGTVTWVPSSDTALAEARRSLLTVSSVVQNTGMVWDGTRTVHASWGGPPTRMLPLSLLLRLHVRADSLKVYPLGPTGQPGFAGPPTYFPSDTNTFAIAVNQNEAPTTWFGIEAFGHGTVLGVDHNPAVPSRFALELNYPNPFNPATMLRFSFPGAGRASLRIYDILGREIDRVMEREVRAGTGEAQWNAAGKASGTYICILRFTSATGESSTATQKILLIK